MAANYMKRTPKKLIAIQIIATFLEHKYFFIAILILELF
jgi:hypothetical protein